MGWVTRSAVITGIAAVALWAGPIAHADGSSFVAYLHDHGYSGRYQGGGLVNPERTVLYGLMACQNVRSGMSMADQQQMYWVLPEFPLVAEAAQHELCPDTLR